MSMAGLLHSDKMCKKSFQNRSDSDELDVFEAARYFSGYHEAVGYPGASMTQKIMKEERPGYRGRISLDMPIRGLLPEQHLMENPIKEKKHKQPNSPGRRLASFLNSLFSQSASKKKKSKSSNQSMKDEDESSGVRRRRRSSISHYSNYTDKKSIYSSSNTGFSTPPPYAQTPTKSYRELRSLSDYKPKVLSLPKHSNCHVKSTALQNELWNDKKQKDVSVFDEEMKISNGLSDKLYMSLAGDKAFDKDRVLQDKNSSEEKGFRKFDEIDEGVESDSSADLFELKIYDLGYSSSGLPVYETTNIDKIKR